MAERAIPAIAQQLPPPFRHTIGGNHPAQSRTNKAKQPHSATTATSANRTKKNTTMTTEPDGKVLISYKKGLNQKEPAGFTTARVALDRIAIMVRTAGQYAPVPFRNGYRDAQHSLPGAELIILDYDSGYTLGEATARFEPYLGLIATTKNHLKPKNGITAERFRVILPTKTPITLGTDHYRTMMKEIIHHHGSDIQCSNISRVYWGNPQAQIIQLNGHQLFDWEPYYNAVKERQQKEQNRQPSDAQKTTTQLDKAIQTYMQNNYTPGNRNGTLYRIARWLQDEGIQNIPDQLRILNQQSSSPLDDAEITHLIRRFQN